MKADEICAVFAFALIFFCCYAISAKVYKQFMSPKTMQIEIRDRINSHREALNLELIPETECPFCSENGGAE